MNLLNHISFITYKPILEYIIELSNMKIFTSNFVYLLLKKYFFYIDYDYCMYDNRYMKLINFLNGTIEIITFYEDKNIENITITYSYYLFSERINYCGNNYFNFEE